MEKSKPSDELLAASQYWFVLMPYTAVDVRTNLRFDARTCTLMITPEFLDWRDDQAKPVGAVPPGKTLEREIKRYEEELRELIAAGLLSFKR